MVQKRSGLTHKKIETKKGGARWKCLKGVLEVLDGWSDVLVCGRRFQSFIVLESRSTCRRSLSRSLWRTSVVMIWSLSLLTLWDMHPWLCPQDCSVSCTSWIVVLYFFCLEACPTPEFVAACCDITLPLVVVHCDLLLFSGYIPASWCPTASTDPTHWTRIEGLV